jgi:hypothetical protein
MNLSSKRTNPVMVKWNPLRSTHRPTMSSKPPKKRKSSKEKVMNYMQKS